MQGYAGGKTEYKCSQKGLSVCENLYSGLWTKYRLLKVKKEEPEAIGNSLYREDNILEIDDANTWGPSNVELTKVLESSVIDSSEMT